MGAAVDGLSAETVERGRCGDVSGLRIFGRSAGPKQWGSLSTPLSFTHWRRKLARSGIRLRSGCAAGSSNRGCCSELVQRRPQVGKSGKFRFRLKG